MTEVIRETSQNGPTYIAVIGFIVIMAFDVLG